MHRCGLGVDVTKLSTQGEGPSAITELPTGRDRRGAVAGDVEDVGDYTELAW